MVIDLAENEDLAHDTALRIRWRFQAAFWTCGHLGRVDLEWVVVD
jgi:hypothetical protein